MNLTLIDSIGMKVVEGTPNVTFLTSPHDVDRLIEECMAERAYTTLLYAANLTSTFFDLSSGDAGIILQKLRNYHIRLAVVAPSATVVFSTRFRDMLDDEQRGTYFGVFETRQAAYDWLQQHAA